MWSYTYLQDINKALICIEHRFRLEIANLRIRLIREEKLLYSTILSLVALEESIKRFYSTYYFERLGRYISVLEALKRRFWGFKEKDREDKKKEEVLEAECDEKELKKVYREIAKIYHPDRYDLLTDEEKEFFEFRMSEANRYFEKKDLRSLKNMLMEAKAELSDDLPSYERIRLLNLRIEMVGELRRLYEKRIEVLKNDEIYRIMSLPPAKREKEIERKKEILLCEIRIYSQLVRNSQSLSQKC